MLCPFKSKAERTPQPVTGQSSLLIPHDYYDSLFNPSQADHSYILKIPGFQLLAEESYLLFYRAVLLDPSFDAIDGMQGSRMIAIK